MALLLARVSRGADTLLLDVGLQSGVPASAVAFGLGFSPPRAIRISAIRMSWSQPERGRLQSATTAMLGATTVDGMARALLPPTARIVGGTAAALVDNSGAVAAPYASAPPVGTHLPPEQPTDPAARPMQIVPLGNDQGQHRPDIIVLDLHLPDLSGRDVLNRLKSDPRTRHIPVVVASADASPGRVRQLREEGPFDYVTKPLDVHRFLEVVDTALEQSHLA